MQESQEREAKRRKVDMSRQEYEAGGEIIFKDVEATYLFCTAEYAKGLRKVCPSSSTSLPTKDTTCVPTSGWAPGEAYCAPKGISLPSPLLFQCRWCHSLGEVK